MKTRSLTLLMTALGLVCAAMAAPVVETQDFADGTGNWYGNASTLTWQASGGVDDSAFIEISRFENMPIVFAQWDTGASLRFVNDLKGHYGVSGTYDQMKISLYAKRLNNYGPTAAVMMFFKPSEDSGQWKHVFSAVSSTDWTLLETTVNYDWTDAEAIAAGWVKEGTVSSWSTVMSNVVNYRTFFSIDSDAYGAGQMVDFGIDNIVFQSAPVPEPATISLLCAGGLLALARRRR